MVQVFKQCSFLEVEKIGRPKNPEFYEGIVRGVIIKHFVYTNKEMGLIYSRKGYALNLQTSWTVTLHCKILFRWKLQRKEKLLDVS